MTSRIELNPTRALEAVREIDDARLRGERPCVTVSDVRGLSPQFVESLMQRDDIDLVIADTDGTLGKDPLESPPAHMSLRRLVAATALIVALASIGVGFVLVG